MIILCGKSDSLTRYLLMKVPQDQTETKKQVAENKDPVTEM
jgi:hypothetical protein